MFILGGVAILCGLLLLGYLFVNADPAKLASMIKWLAIGVAVVLFLFLLLSERFAFLWLPLTLAFPYLRGYLRSFLAKFNGPSAGSNSEVGTAYLRMTLDHDTGAMTGTVMAGAFAGMRLDELVSPTCWRCCASAAPPTPTARAWSKPISTGRNQPGAMPSAGRAVRRRHARRAAI